MIERVPPSREARILLSRQEVTLTRQDSFEAARNNLRTLVQHNIDNLGDCLRSYNTLLQNWDQTEFNRERLFDLEKIRLLAMMKAYLEYAPRKGTRQESVSASAANPPSEWTTFWS